MVQMIFNKTEAGRDFVKVTSDEAILIDEISERAIDGVSGSCGLVKRNECERILFGQHDFIICVVNKQRRDFGCCQHARC